MQNKRVSDSPNLHSQNYLKILLERISEPAFMFAVDHMGHYGNFMIVNNAICQRLGYRKEELLKLSMYDIDFYLRAQVDKMPEIIKFSELYIFQTIHVGKEGKPIPTKMSVYAFDYKENIILLGVAQDII